MDNYKYITAMFPYPSGQGLHLGHWYNYAVLDSYCKYLRYKGERVFQPFGYDSFGLPAENYAKKINGDPREVTENNISNFRLEMKKMNTSFEDLLVTSSPEYIKHTQWIFTKLYEKGLAYKKLAVVNWCTSCETVLANEQVKDWKCDRCNSQVKSKKLNQWFFKITDYKDRLLKNLDSLDYPQSTINAQREWLKNQRDWCVSRQRSWGCPIPIEGETDTLDTFVDSSFYTVIYSLLKDLKPKPVDLYVGGKEHACMHLIYARFITMFLNDIGFIDFEEPFKKVIHQGMVLNEGKKISKSLGNLVDVSNYSSSTIRMFLMFLGPYNKGGSWSKDRVKGIVSFQRRLKTWLIDKPDGYDSIDLGEFKSKIDSYMLSFKFNKVISEFMILNKNHKQKNLNKETKSELITILDSCFPDWQNFN